MSSSNTIILDVDGVCADFVGAVLATAGSPFPRDTIRRFEFFAMLEESAKRALFAGMEEDRWWMQLDPVPGAMTGVRLLRDAGYHIVFATVAWPACKNWANVRREWLWSHLSDVDYDLMVGDRKDLLRCRAIVDDKAETIDRCVASGNAGTCYIYPTSYNTECRARRFDWQTLGGLV